MNRTQFLILTSLSGVIAVSILLQISLIMWTQSDDLRLKRTDAALQEGQLCLNRLQQIAGRVAQVAQQQNDQGLKDLLVRQNIQFRQPASSASAPVGPATPTTPEAPSTH
jgi:hypothetical protein